MKNRTIIAFVLLATLVLGCMALPSPTADVESTVAAAMAATQTAQPTATPTPTATHTPHPTSTATPSPTATPHRIYLPIAARND